MRRAVARFPSAVEGVGEVVEAIITVQTKAVDAFVIFGKYWLELKLVRNKKNGKILPAITWETSLSPKVNTPAEQSIEAVIEGSVVSRADLLHRTNSLRESNSAPA